MILAAVLVQAMPTAPAPLAEPDQGNEIVVMSQRLRSIRISPGVKIRKGVVTQTSACKIKRSSGDAEIDALACDAVTLCAASLQPNRKAFNACVDSKAVDAILRLRDARVAAANGEAL